GDRDHWERAPEQRAPDRQLIERRRAVPDEPDVDRVVPAADRTVEEQLREKEPDPYQEGGKDEVPGDRHHRTGRDRPMGPQETGEPWRQAGAGLEDRGPFHGLGVP